MISLEEGALGVEAQHKAASLTIKFENIYGS